MSCAEHTNLALPNDFGREFLEEIISTEEWRTLSFDKKKFCRIKTDTDTNRIRTIDKLSISACI